MLKISTGRRQTSWLFTSVVEAELKPGTSGFHVRRPNRWARPPPPDRETKPAMVMFDKYKAFMGGLISIIALAIFQQCEKQIKAVTTKQVLTVGPPTKVVFTT